MSCILMGPRECLCIISEEGLLVNMWLPRESGQCSFQSWILLLMSWLRWELLLW